MGPGPAYRTPWTRHRHNRPIAQSDNRPIDYAFNSFTINTMTNHAYDSTYDMFVLSERYSLCPSVLLTAALSPSPICSSYSCPFASLVYVKRVDLYSETDQVGLHTQFISRGEAHGNYLSLLCRRADGGHLCASHTERYPVMVKEMYLCSTLL